MNMPAGIGLGNNGGRIFTQDYIEKKLKISTQKTNWPEKSVSCLKSSLGRFYLGN